MQFLTRNAALQRNLLRCVEQYSQVSFAVAWASADTEVFRALTSGRTRIHRAVIGTQFYQTHPDVLDAFVGSSSVRFMLQPSGVFHPKIFVFSKRREWEAFVGSANLTRGALTANSEAVLLLSRVDVGDYALRDEVAAVIDSYWEAAESMTEEKASRYRAMWLQRQPTLQRLAGQYSGSRSRRPPTASEVMSMGWGRFYETIQNDTEHEFRDRCEFLREVHAAFRETPTFGGMDTSTRRMVSGLSSDRDARCGWFGSMMGNGKFQQAVNANVRHLSDALDAVPRRGVVTRTQYDDFLAEYVRAFPEGRDGIATATRLLAMKRPDEFVCFDSMNRRRLCEDIGIAPSGMTYDRYWDEIIERVREAPWWNSPRPGSEGLELDAWMGRAAMLDAIFYVHEPR